MVKPFCRDCGVDPTEYHLMCEAHHIENCETCEDPADHYRFKHYMLCPECYSALYPAS